MTEHQAREVPTSEADLAVAEGVLHVAADHPAVPSRVKAALRLLLAECGRMRLELSRLRAVEHVAALLLQQRRGEGEAVEAELWERLAAIVRRPPGQLWPTDGELRARVDDLPPCGLAECACEDTGGEG